MATKKSSSVKAAAAKNKAASARSGNPIPKSSLTSAITTDLPNTAPDDGMTEVDLSKATVKVPAESIASAPARADANWSDADEQAMKTRDNSFEQRIIDHGLGQVQVEGIDFRYVGIAPARDKDAETEHGYPITPMNTRFTPLMDVAFHPSIRCKDSETGKYYYPADGTTGWGDVVSPDGNPLVPKEADKKAAKERRENLKAARRR